MDQKPKITDLITNKLTIPTLPEIVMRINKLLEDPETGTREIGALVAQDAPLAAKVLKVANSAFYGLQGECTSTEHASTVLGVKVLKNLVLQVAVMKEFEHLEQTGFDLAGLWKHAIHTARLAAFSATRASNVQLAPEEVYVCGLLHDVGKVVMLDSLTEQYLAVFFASTQRNVPMHVAERQEFGFTHADVGAAVCRRWGLPDRITSTVGLHHGPPKELERQTIATLVNRVDEISHRILENNLPAASAAIDEAFGARLGLTGVQVDEIVTFAAEHVSEDG